MNNIYVLNEYWTGRDYDSKVWENGVLQNYRIFSTKEKALQELKKYELLNIDLKERHSIHKENLIFFENDTLYIFSNVYFDKEYGDDEIVADFKNPTLDEVLKWCEKQYYEDGVDYDLIEFVVSEFKENEKEFKKTIDIIK